MQTPVHPMPWRELKITEDDTVEDLDWLSDDDEVEPQEEVVCAEAGVAAGEDGDAAPAGEVAAGEDGEVTQEDGVVPEPATEAEDVAEDFVPGPAAEAEVVICAEAEVAAEEDGVAPPAGEIVNVSDSTVHPSCGKRPAQLPPNTQFTRSHTTKWRRSARLSNAGQGNVSARLSYSATQSIPPRTSIKKN